MAKLTFVHSAVIKSTFAHALLAKSAVADLRATRSIFAHLVMGKSTFSSLMPLKACVRYFLTNFYFSPNDSPLKTMKDVFYFI